MDESIHTIIEGMNADAQIRLFAILDEALRAWEAYDPATGPTSPADEGKALPRRRLMELAHGLRKGFKSRKTLS